MSDKTKSADALGVAERVAEGVVGDVVEDVKFAADADEDEQPAEQAGDQVLADMMRVVLKQIGENPDREGLRRTPERFEKSIPSFFARKGTCGTRNGTKIY